MNFKRLLVLASAAAVCAAFTACSGSEDSSSAAENSSKAAVSSVSTADNTESAADNTESSTDEGENVAIDGTGELYSALAEKYADGYTLTMTEDNSGQSIDFNFTKSGDQAYQSSVVSGMKSYQVAPGDGVIYNVSEATTTYTEEEETEESIVSLDFLFGATGDFTAEEENTVTKNVYEHFALNEDISKSAGEIIYCFDGTSKELISIQIAYDGVEFPEKYTVTGLKEPDMTLLEKPDLSAYTKQ